MVFSTHNCSGSSFSLFYYTKRLQKFRLCIGNWMSVQPAFQGSYIQPVSNLQNSLRLKTVKYGGSAASFLNTSWLPPAVLSRLPSPTWNLQPRLLLAEPKAHTTPVTLSLCACLEQSHTSPAQPHHSWGFSPELSSTTSRQECQQVLAAT